MEDLASSDIEVLLPTHKVRRRWSDRYKVIEEPLFTNYIFVNVGPENRRKCLRPYGAVHFVGFDGTPAVIPAAEIDAVRKLLAADLPRNPYPYLKAGRRVRVKYGPLEGCEGLLVRKRDVSRLVLSIHLLQRSVIAEIDAAWVEPV
jgi:transcription antitermination factor NusG